MFPSPRRRRAIPSCTLARWKKVLLAVLGALVLGAALVSAPWCPVVVPRPPEPLMIGASKVALRAGAAVVPLKPPFPVVRAGYGPSRPTARRAASPLSARALVVDSGGTTWGLVVLDALLIPTELADAVRARAGLSEVWVAATHTHSSFGGFDRRWAAQVAGLGAYDQAAYEAMLEGALLALKQAGAALAPVRVSAGTSAPPDLSVPRTGPSADGRLTRVAFDGPERAVAEVLIASAHPTVIPRENEELDADWPGALAAAREASGAGVSLVVQGAAGNATVAFHENESLAQWVERIAAAAAAVPLKPAGDAGLVVIRMGVTLPEVDVTRLVSAPLQPAVRNVLCTQSDAYITLSLVRLGQLNLLAVPGEPSFAAGRALEEKGGADRLVALTGGYLGYVEPAEVVGRGEGEARRQYYGPALAAALEEGARAALEALALVVGGSGEAK